MKINAYKFHWDKIFLVKFIIISLIMCIYSSSLKTQLKNKLRNTNDDSEESNDQNNTVEFVPLKIKKQYNPYLNPLKSSLLTIKRMSNLDRNQIWESDQFNYLNSANYITEQEEFNLEQANQFQLNSSTCILDRYLIIERINELRNKHQVKKLKYDSLLEAQATQYGLKMQKENNCEYYNSEKNHFSENFSVNYSRLSERQVIDKWYEPIYHFDFKNKKFKINGINAYSSFNLLWDETEKVGCTKVCCLTTELYICDFFPVLIQPTIEEIASHIKPNKYLDLYINSKSTDKK